MKFEIYEQALCCVSGGCGARNNEEILRISSVAETLKARGIKLTVWNLMRTPRAFAGNKKVMEYVRANGQKALPVCALDGEIIIKGRYPTNEELIKYLELDAHALDCLLPPEKLICEE